VLSGGGANGAYEIGVLKALVRGDSPATDRRPLDPHVIAATSIGAFNAAVLLSNLTDSWSAAVGALEAAWTDRIAIGDRASRNGVFRLRANPMSWIDAGLGRSSPLKPARDLVEDAAFLARDWSARALEFTTSDGSLERRAAELMDLSTLVTSAPSAELVRDTVALPRVRASRVALRVAATRWSTGALRVFSNAEFTDAAGADIVLASSAIPGIFPPVSIGQELYVDGGVVLNTPLEPAIGAGAESLHVVYLDPHPAEIPLKRVGSTIDTVGRMFTISFAATMRRDLEIAARINGTILAARDAAARGIAPTEPLHRGGRAYRPLQIHLHHPDSDWGGALGMLDFRRDRVASLIERGYADAVRHDCAKAGCVGVTVAQEIGGLT